jgi:hypothetical protein
MYQPGIEPRNSSRISTSSVLEKSYMHIIKLKYEYVFVGSKGFCCITVQITGFLYFVYRLFFVQFLAYQRVDKVQKSSNPEGSMCYIKIELVENVLN